MIYTVKNQIVLLIPCFVGGVDTASTDGTFDISNSDRLGKSEVELMQLVIDGVTKLVEMEKKLEKKQSIENLFPNDLVIATEKVSNFNMLK